MIGRDGLSASAEFKNSKTWSLHCAGRMPNSFILPPLCYQASRNYCMQMQSVQCLDFCRMILGQCRVVKSCLWLTVDNYQIQDVCLSENLIPLLRLFNGQNTMTCINLYSNLDSSNVVLDENT